MDTEHEMVSSDELARYLYKAHCEIDPNISDGTPWDNLSDRCRRKYIELDM